VLIEDTFIWDTDSIVGVEIGEVTNRTLDLEARMKQIAQRRSIAESMTSLCPRPRRRRACGQRRTAAASSHGSAGSAVHEAGRRIHVKDPHFWSPPGARKPNRGRGWIDGYLLRRRFRRSWFAWSTLLGVFRARGRVGEGSGGGMRRSVPIHLAGDRKNREGRGGGGGRR
jgi:hypothetical protein